MTQDDAIRIVLRGFDEGVFVRNTDGDHDPAWAIKLFPYIQALGVLQASVDDAKPLADTRVCQVPCCGQTILGEVNQP